MVEVGTKDIKINTHIINRSVSYSGQSKSDLYANLKDIENNLHACGLHEFSPLVLIHPNDYAEFFRAYLNDIILYENHKDTVFGYEIIVTKDI